MLYVDDLVITSNSEEKIVWLKVQLANRFKMIDLGQLGCYLGIHFSFTKEGVFVSQRPYIKDMLQMFGMMECNSTKVPMVEGTRHHKHE
jgi:hypothetical protein